MLIGQIVYHRIKGVRAELLHVGRKTCRVRLTECGSISLWRLEDVSGRPPWICRGSLDYLYGERGHSERRARA